jgi:VWFA-related protein
VKALTSSRIRWLSVAGLLLSFLGEAPHGRQTTFRSGVDVIAVDVDVLGRDGTPVANLGPGQFEVLIDGKARKVVSADFIEAATRTATSRATAPAGTGTLPNRPAGADNGRVFILAFDTMTFLPAPIAPARDAARAFVQRLQPHDRVGLIAFPMGSTIDASTDRTRLYAELDRLVGLDTSQTMNRFNLAPSDVIDLSRVPPDVRELSDLQRTDPLTYGKGLEICARSRDLEMCQRMLIQETKTQAQFEEMEISQRLGALQALFRSLAPGAQRKTVILVSAGILQTDRVGGRPDLGDIGRLIGQSAAEADCAIYVLHFDRLQTDQMSASRGGAPRQGEMTRDSTILARPLSDIAGSAGGGFYTVVQGGGEFAFDQILKETSAYYLLGVEPAARDRDGRAHQLRVKVTARDVTVRGRSWVTLPKPGAVASAAPAPGGPASSPETSASPPAPRPLPESVRALADAYARRDAAAVDRLLSGSANLARLTRDFRDADPPWPDTPARSDVLALDLAIAGLANANGFARDEGLKLLTLTHLVVEQSAQHGAFACKWFWAEAAALEGLSKPETSLPFVERARRRCPAEPRLTLARAVILEQQSKDRPDRADLDNVLGAYQEVQAPSEAATEALVRAAWFACRHGEIERAAKLLPETAGSAPEPYVRYIYYLAKGQLLRARGQLEDAALTYRRALDEQPGAQSARVALMTLRLIGGDSPEAEQLAESILTAGNDQQDPWWTYPLGDFRMYPAILNTLWELGQ